MTCTPFFYEISLDRWSQFQDASENILLSIFGSISGSPRIREEPLPRRLSNTVSIMVPIFDKPKDIEIARVGYTIIFLGWDTPSVFFR